ncbi:MAG: hypothetical protein ACQEP1_00805 [Nanobdellota archaeon]
MGQFPEKLRSGIAIDLDDTVFNTSLHWYKTLVSNFGKPPGLGVGDIEKRYGYFQQVPYFQGRKAEKLFEHMVHGNGYQEKLPLNEGAKDRLDDIQSEYGIAGYVTARPEDVREGTENSLGRHNLPEAPLIMRQDNEDDHNRWKGLLISENSHLVRGIIDDNPSLIEHLSYYDGTVFLFGKKDWQKDGIDVVPCMNWKETYKKLKERYAHL